MKTSNTQLTEGDLDKINLMDLSEQEIIELIENTYDLTRSVGASVERMFYSQMVTAGAVQFMTKSQIKKIYNRIQVQNNVRWVLAENISNGGHFASISSPIQIEIENLIGSKLDDDEKLDATLAWLDSEEAARWGQGR